ncbi:unnamed protein product [Pylaiella littoralis]
MGGSRGGSVGSYSSGSANNVDVAGKYGADDTKGKIAKMEKDIASADKTSKKQQKNLAQTSAANKAEDMASLDGAVDHGNGGGGSDSGGDESDEVKNIMEDLAKRAPEEVFQQFDTDGSGLIDFDEFRAMLPQLGINITMPKALKYFRMSDPDGSGEIDFEEFKVALFAVDPDSGNPVGFTPNALLSPLDAFEMFDEDKSGKIDEDEFFFLLQYLGIETSEVKLEQMFKKYDTDQSGYIEYAEFKKIWVRMANVKKELTDRGIKIPKVATNRMLYTMLEQILEVEEDRERRAIAEAERWAKWQLLLKDKRRAYEKAQRRSKTELKAALDTGGSVWIFGTGPFGEFTAPPPKTLRQGEHDFAHYDIVKSMWGTRVNPPATAPEPIKLGEKHARRRRREMGLGSSTQNSNSSATKGDESSIENFNGDELLTDNQDNHVDPEEDKRTSPFADLCVARSTASLWGRRIVAVTTSDSAAFAVSELGEGYAWGGKDHWWFEIGPDSHWQEHWRGDTTERSRLLLQTLHKQEPEEIAPEEEEDEEEKEACSCFFPLTTLIQYYGMWKPPPTHHRLDYIQHELLPKIKHPEVKYSLQCRGKHVEDMNKDELLQLLYDDIVLEKKVLGERRHRQIRQLELETLHMYEKGKNIMGKSLRLEIEEMWTPLREIQAEDAAMRKANEEAGLGTDYARGETVYSQWRERIRKGRDDASPVFTPRGNSLKVNLGGVTDRAGELRSPRANDAAVAISAGANHVLLVHRSGQLYTWGVGASGRLGLDLSEGGNPQADAAAATVIQAFAGRPVLKASAAYNHSSAITTSGRVYTWGSAATGKLGLGVVDRDVYCSVPTRVMIDSPTKVKEISSGAAHTACVTASGQLFVWGCGDGGRLGLGEERLGPQYEPVLVESLSTAGERIAAVSCGNSHTLALTAVREGYEGEGEGRAKEAGGGRMFQAGSTNVLGTFCPAFTAVMGLEEVMVKQVSAGYGHSCCCTTQGELYTWGSNRDGCLGLPRSTKFANYPQLVACLYVSPKNLAIGRPSRQSSVYDGLNAGLAVDGDRSGNHYRKCSCTQQDPQGWWEVDLGQLVHVHQVKVWNRCDEPTDPSMERNFYAKRLFPCWVMVSQEPFKDDVGGAALLDAINAAVARAHFKEDRRCSVWRCPDQTMARYVRVQLQGFDFLHMAQVEVFGTTGARRSPGKVTQCCAGKYVTTAVMAAAQDSADVEAGYKKAVQADAFNAEVLREFETFFAAHDQWGRGDAIRGCMLCKAGILCEICAMKHEFRDELRDLPLGPGGSVQRLSSIAQFLFDKEKPNLNYQTPVKKGTGIISSVRGKLAKLLAPLQGSVGGSTTTASDDDSDTESGGGGGGGGGGLGKTKRKKFPVVSEGGSSSRTASTDGNNNSSNNGDDAGAAKRRANQEYHVGTLRGSLSSSRSSSSSTTTANDSSAASITSSEGGANDSRSSSGGSSSSSSSAVGGGGRSVRNASSSIGGRARGGGSTDRSSGSMGSSATGSSISSAASYSSSDGGSSGPSAKDKRKVTRSTTTGKPPKGNTKSKAKQKVSVAG